MPRHLRHLQLILWSSLALLTIFNQTASLLAHGRRAADPNFFNDDVRQQIFPFLRVGAELPFRDDYIAQYYLDNFPLGYRAVYNLASRFDCAEQLSKSLPYVLLLVMIVGVGIAAHRLAGPIAVVTSTAILLGSGIYLDRMSGGLPRAFGFPIVALSLAALAHGNVWFLVAVTIMAAAFYPVAGVIAGISLGLWVLCFPASTRGQASSWSWRRRVAIVSFTCGVCVTMLLAPATGSAKYGRVITSERVGEFPEVGPGGRYIAADRAPFASLPSALHQTVGSSLFGAGTPWWRTLRELVTGSDAASSHRARSAVTLSFSLLALGVWLLAARRCPRVLRLLILPLVASVTYVAASQVAPYLYLPQRYLIYSVPLCATLFVSTFVGLLVSSVSKVVRPIHHLTIAGASLVILLIFGGRGSHDAGLETHADSESELLEAIGRLPTSAVVAAWPVGLADFIPYCARRRVFVSYEIHQAFHVGYTLEMRRRVAALIAALAADSSEPLVRLYREFGVTHLVVRDEFSRGQLPGYFLPFDHPIRLANARHGNRTPETERQLEAAAVFSHGGSTILSLARIANGTAGAQ